MKLKIADRTRFMKNGVVGDRRADFALVICPPWQTEMPALWPAQLVSSLRSNGFEGACHDVNNHVYRRVDRESRDLWVMDRVFRWQRPRSFGQVWRRVSRAMNGVVEQILDRRPRLVGFSTTEASILSSLCLAQMIKEAEPGTTIVFGGPGIYWTSRFGEADVPHNIVDHLDGERPDARQVVDLYLRGEANESLPQLVYHLLHGLDPLDVPGAVAYRDGRWVSPRPIAAAGVLDRLPFPDYSDLDVSSFAGRSMPLLFSRGCFRSCAFCNDCHIQGRYRRRSGDNAFEEVRQLKQLYGTDGLAVVDLLLNGDLHSLSRFCDLILRSGIQIRWGGQALVHPGMDAALLQKMAAAGCVELTLGIESLSQPVIDMMHKGFSVTQAATMMRQAHEAGIRIAINLLVGFPGETSEMFCETIDGLERERASIDRVQAINTCHVTHGSYLDSNYEDYGVDINVPEHWFRWRGPHGNTYEERKRRIAMLEEVVARLGLTVAEKNLFDEGEATGQAEITSASAQPAALRISEVSFLDAAGRAGHALETGDPLGVRIGYQATRPVESPLVRLQLFNNENPAARNQLVFGTNTDRFDLRLGTLAVGSGAVELQIGQLNLLPGTYRVTVGFWPDEQSADPLDAHHGAYRFTVRGEQDARGTAHVQTHWHVVSQEERDDLLPGELTLVEREGARGACFGTGETVRGRFLLPLARASSVEMAGVILRDGIVVHRCEHQHRLETGSYSVELTAEAIPLLQGQHELQVFVIEADTGDELSSCSATFQVHSRRRQGAGIVYCPATWNLEGVRTT